MRVPSEAELLSLWEEGLSRHPIDRALLLCAWARRDIAVEAFAGLPLGTVNAGLLTLRAALFGTRLELRFECGHCGEPMEAPLDIGELLAGAPERESGAEIEVDGFRFRLPASSDLAAVACHLDAEAAVSHLLDICCVSRPEGGMFTPDLRAEVDSRLEAADPMADLGLSAVCAACGRSTDAVLDPGALLWEDIQAHAHGLLAQVHGLARAYGWTEHEVLSLSPRRRAAYLEMAGG